MSMHSGSLAIAFALACMVALGMMLMGCVPTVTPTPPSPITVTVTPTPITVTATPFVSPPITPISPLATPVAVATKFPTVTLTVIPIPASNLPNSSFEEPYHCSAAFCVADKWAGWFLNPPPCPVGHPGCFIQCPLNCVQPSGNCSNDNGCSWAQPEFSRADYFLYPYRVRSGQGAQQYFGFGRMFDGGVYQRVNVQPGRWYEFSVWMQTWMCYNYDLCNGGRRSDEPTTMHLRVGLDPTGGMDPIAASVIWGPEGDSFDVWSLFSVRAQAQGSKMTMFTRAWPDWGGGHLRLNNNVYLDDADLKPIDPPLPLTNFVYLPGVLR